MIPIRILDIIDILLVAFLLYQLYRVIRGTTAFSIFLGVFAFYLFWLMVRALNMELISSILGQVIGVGVIAMIILFQQEIRRFLLVIGNRYMGQGKWNLHQWIKIPFSETRMDIPVATLVDAVEALARDRTGALIVLERKSQLSGYMEGATYLNAEVSSELLLSVFFKNSPLHDGAVIIRGEKIIAASCPLPVSDNPYLPSRLGMRHRAALGISEQTDCLVLVVSEERGVVSLADHGNLRENLSMIQLHKALERENKHSG